MRPHRDEHTHTHMYDLWCVMNFSKRHIANTSTKWEGIAYLAQWPGYRMDSWKIVVRFPTKAKDFSLLQRVPSDFKYSTKRARAGLSLAVQWPKCEGDHSPPSNVEVKNQGALYLHFLICFTVYTRTTLLYLCLYIYVKKPALMDACFHSVHLLVQRMQRYGQGQLSGCCEHGNWPECFIKHGQFLG